MKNSNKSVELCLRLAFEKAVEGKRVRLGTSLEILSKSA